MSESLARTLMEEFAETTGVSGKSKPRRYLWTDAFAVCNFLGLFQQSGNDRFLKFAQELVNQVHFILGRHRDDDRRHGWISGLSEEEGERHPTRGGLRIGKTLQEREPDEPQNSQIEWERDGQYFHYLTKWIHALHRMACVTGDSRYQQWAAELAATAHASFTHEMSPSGPKRMVWKMSIDLSRPLVYSMGQHDPLDGLVTCLELQSTEQFKAEVGVDLTGAIADLNEMSGQTSLATDDPLGIGGLLDSATRLAQLVFQRGVMRHNLLHLLHQLLIAAGFSLESFSRSYLLGLAAEHRLAFRELGLSIGIHGLQRIGPLVAQDRDLSADSDSLMPYQPLAKQISTFWSDPARRVSSTWMDHRDINSVMLATSLAPEGYLLL